MQTPFYYPVCDSRIGLSNYLIAGHCGDCFKTQLHQCTWMLCQGSSSWQSCDVTVQLMAVLRLSAIFGSLFSFACCLASSWQIYGVPVTSETVILPPTHHTLILGS